MTNLLRVSFFLACSLSLSVGSICRTWFYHPHKGEAECVCGSNLNGIIHCDDGSQNVSIMTGFCMTPFSDNNQTLVVGRCLIAQRNVFLPRFRSHSKLPPNASDVENVTCYHLNRCGRLCGKCSDNHYTLTYSYNYINCVRCTSNVFLSILKYIGIAYVPMTVFCLIIFVFHMNIFSPQMSCVVVICQILTSPVFFRGFVNHDLHLKNVSDYYVHVLATVYGIWNLDFFRNIIPHPICLPLDPLQVTLLDYIVALYPLLLFGLLRLLFSCYERNNRVVVWLLKPLVILSLCFRRQWNIKHSLIDSFASFIILSCMKFLSTSAIFLTYTETRNVLGGWMGTYLFIDPSIKYFGRDHLPYAITAVITTATWILFSFILILYPMMWFQKLLNKLRLNSPTLHIMMQCFHGHYRDRTDGGRERRYFSAVYLLLRVSCFVTFSSTHELIASPIFVIILIITGLIIGLSKPYRYPYNKIDLFLILSLGILCASELILFVRYDVTGPRKRTIYFINLLTAILAHVPLAYFVILVFVYVKKWLQR